MLQLLSWGHIFLAVDHFLVFKKFKIPKESTTNLPRMANIFNFIANHGNTKFVFVPKLWNVLG